MSDRPQITPTMIPSSDDDLTVREVFRDIFNGNHKAIRKGISIVNKQYDHDIGVNGRSTKHEMASYMANNMSRDGVKIIANKAFEAIEE